MRGVGVALRQLSLKRTGVMVRDVGGLGLSLAPIVAVVVPPVAWLESVARDPLWRPSRVVWALSLGQMCFVGYFILVHVLGAYQRGRLSLIPYAVLLPAYWVLMSIGAWRGVLQFFVKPFHWEK